MRKKILVITFYMTLWAISNAIAQVSNRSFQDHVFFYNLLETNLSINDILIEQLPNDAHKGLLISYQAMIKAVLKPSQEVLDELIATESNAMELTEEGAGVGRDWMEAEALWHWTIVHYLAGNEWSAFLRFRASYRLMEQVNSDHPDFIPAQKSLAAFKIVLSIVPEQYEWALRLLSMNPDAKKGVLVLERLTHETSFHGVEATVMMSLLQTYLYKEPHKGLSYFEKIDSKYSKLAGIQYLGSMLYQKNNQAVKAIDLIENINIQEDWLKPWLYWQKGNLLLYAAQFQKATIFFQGFTDIFEGKHFVKDVYYKRFICSWLDTTTVTNLSLLDSITMMGAEQTAADKYAKAFAVQSLPHPRLMYVRMLFDGGSFSEAESIWREIELKGLKDQKDSVEWAYRGGRVAQGLNESLLAIERFEQAIVWQPYDKDWYYAPNACLQLGYLLKERKAFKASKQFYEQVLRYQDFPYETAIKQEAKAQLK